MSVQSKKDFLKAGLCYDGLVKVILAIVLSLVLTVGGALGPASHAPCADTKSPCACHTCAEGCCVDQASQTADSIPVLPAPTWHDSNQFFQTTLNTCLTILGGEKDAFVIPCSPSMPVPRLALHQRHCVYLI